MKKALKHKGFKALVGEGGFEPPKSVTTDLQAVEKSVFTEFF